MLWWADFPSGQRGLYGTNDDFTLNGIYAQFDSDYVIATDPDGLSGGLVLREVGTVFSPTVRVVRPAGATPTIGVARRVWFTTLPTSDAFGNRLVSFRSAANAVLAYLSVTSTGRIAVIVNGGATYTSTLPNITANGWYHIEMKYTHGVGALCSFEVRVEGSAIADLTQTNVAGTGADPAQIASYSSSSIDTYMKDLVCWDGTGTEVTDFIGSCGVYDILPTADVTLGGWTTSSGATGYSLIQDNAPSNFLTVSGAIPTDTGNVQIASTYYRFTTGSVDAGTPAGTSANPWLVAYAGSDANALANLRKAINASGVAGTDYSTALTAHSTVTAVGVSATVLNVQAIDGVTSNITCAETLANVAWNASTLTGGPTDLSYIQSAVPPTVASEFTFSDIPADVTSVKGIISIARLHKTDGGDAQVQVSLSSDGVSYDAGADRTITTAPTFYTDVSTIDAATGAAYLPSAVNTIRAKINRTV